MQARVEFYESLKPQTAQDEAFVGGMADDNAAL
jgi:hypothetical protein